MIGGVPPCLFDAETAAEAVAVLRDRDPVLRTVIDRVGPLRLTPERDLFALLVRVVISQQISMAAAKTVAGRLKAATPRGRFTAKAIDGLTLEEVQACGMSWRKAEYVRNVAAAVRSRELVVSQLPALDDAEVTARIVAVRGLGVWSARMLLMFGLGRPDVFPSGDLGVRNAARDLYGIEEKRALDEHAAASWKPWRTAAAWYLWRHADQKGVTEGLNAYPV